MGSIFSTASPRYNLFLRGCAWYYLLLLLVVLAAFSGVVGNDFAFDDIPRIAHSSRISSLTKWIESLGSAIYPGDLYRPVFELSLLFNVTLSGLNPLAFHVTDLLIHYANCCLLLRLSAPILGVCPARWCVLLYACNPLLAEAVANVNGRAETLCLFFGLLAMLSGRRYLTAGSGWRLVGSLTALFFSILSKESGLTFCAGFPLLFWYSANRDALHVGRLKQLLLGVGVVVMSVFIIRILVLRHYAFGSPASSLDNLFFVLPAWQRALNGFYILGRYVAAIIAPLYLMPECSRAVCQIRFPPFMLQDVIVVAGVMSLLFYGVWGVVQREAVGFCLAWFFLLLATTSNVLMPI